MAPLSRRPLSPVDAAWYRMDRPNNPAVVTGLLRLKGTPDRDTVRDLFAERLLSFERFQCRVVERGWPWSLPYWERDPTFDLDAHVQHLALPAPADKATLLALVSDLASESLPPHRPPWQAFLIDEGVDRCSLIMRFHHCMADGTGSVALARHLLDPLAPSPEPDGSAHRPSSLPSAASLLGRTTRYLATGLRAGVNRLLHPVDTLRQIPSLAEALETAAEDVLQRPDASTPLRGSLTGRQRLAYSDPIPLADVKAIGDPFDATVNDVLGAALTGAVRHYLLEHGAAEPLPRLHAIVPVDLRAQEDARELGNAFGLTFLPLPLTEETPADRLRATKREMDAIKRSPEARVFLNILGLFGQLPHAAEDAASSLFASKATMVLTNVTGPARQHSLAECPVEDIVFWVPHPVSLGVGVSILSYAGRVTVGVMTDDGLVSDPTALTDRFSSEFEALRARSLPEQEDAPTVNAE